MTPKSNFLKKYWRIIDQQSLIAIALLMLFSLMLVATASPAVANRIGLTDHYFLSRHIIFLALAVILLFVFSALDKQWVRRVAILGYIFTLIMLVLVKFFGFEVKGATRWINIAGFSYQPSEFMKPFLAVVSGWILSLRSYDNFPGFKVSLVTYLAVAALLIIQPDFGMLVMISAVFGIQLFVAGLPIIWIIITIFSFIVGAIGAYLLLPHVAARINKFLDPVNSENYQITRSIEAFESGGLYGKGPGEGVVKQFLPDAHTDFIFAAAGEEFGALICIIIISIFAYIIIRNLNVLIYENDRFVQIAGVGLISQFGLQSIINIGVTLNLLPTKGMTLPFISYGGSSTLAISIGLGMLMSITKRQASLVKYKVHYEEI